ncbi:inner centromere protein a-like protein [Lasius niger]|uniref:Inner centromere protein a-like protein n=1 Tax=Lasius niger TaxID=67767 RepID=A0A0J7KN30_LASNI|nr:inner centromere protein a-like protein [Lasius niger]
MLIVFGLSHGDGLPSRIEVENLSNRTINEVEKLIRQNLTLPHLTRREIIDILLNITTSEDLEALQNKETIEKARKIYERALMVVLPYNVKDAKENIKDLYTKPPIVQIIADSSSNSKDFKVSKSEKLQSSTSTQEMQRDKQSLENLIVTHASEKENPFAKTRYKNHKETYIYSEAHTETPLKETLKFESAPIKFSFNLDNLQKQQAITETLVSTTRRPVFQEESSSIKNEEVHIVYSTSAHTNTKHTHTTTMRTMGTSPKKENVLTSDLKELQTTSRPLKYNENVLSVDQWRYNAPSTTQSFTTSAKALDDIQMTDAKQSTTTPTSLFSSSSSSFSEKLKYNSTYSLNSGGFRTITITTTTTTPHTMRPEVMELLASIGLRPENSTNVEEVFEKNQGSLKNKSEIPNSNGFDYTKISGLTAVVPPLSDSPSITAQNTFENPIVEIGKGMNNLTPDVQLLFQRFGLQTSNLVTTTTSTPSSTVNTNSYTNFKPLPTSKIKNEDMKEFLAKFGLGISDNRQKKAMPASRGTERPSLIEVVPDNMRQILENIGLISPKVSKTIPKMEDIEPKDTTKFHVFKPHEVEVKDERQKMKINELLDTINKFVQEGKTSATDVQKVADDLLVSTKTLKNGPDPLHLEEIIRINNEDVKNEVKRQNPEETVNTTSIGDEDLTKTTTTTTGIKRFMISVLGTSESWLKQIIQGLARIRRMLINMEDMFRRSSD